MTTAAQAARIAYHSARATYPRQQLEAVHSVGADGTDTMLIDVLVETAILNAVDAIPVNILSEEAGHIDKGHAATLVMDPLDGSANAAAGVPLACFSAALVVDGEFDQALTCWVETGNTWHASERGAWDPLARPLIPRPSANLADAAIDLLRPHTDKPAGAGWWAIATAAKRVRILSCSTLETALVADGSIHAFADAGSDTHRIVDLAFAATLDRLGIASLRDLHDRPVEFDVDLTRRWSGIFASNDTLALEVQTRIKSGIEAGDSPESQCCDQHSNHVLRHSD
ncbi:inositol monophosphatase family protein [Nocardia sp. NPDC004711]